VTGRGWVALAPARAAVLVRAKVQVPRTWAPCEDLSMRCERRNRRGEEHSAVWGDGLTFRASTTATDKACNKITLLLVGVL